MVTARTPGQAFRETLRQRWAARGHAIDTRPWDALPEIDREDLEAAAKAAIGAEILAVIKAAEGDTVIIAFRFTMDLQQAAEIRQRAEEHAPGVRFVIAVDAVAVEKIRAADASLMAERDEARVYANSCAEDLDDAGQTISVMERERDRLRDEATQLRYERDQLAGVNETLRAQLARERDLIRDMELAASASPDAAAPVIGYKTADGKIYAPEDVTIIKQNPATSQDSGGHEVHVDWRMTPDEWGQFCGVLFQHAEVPYISGLISAGAIPAGPDGGSEGSENNE